LVTRFFLRNMIFDINVKSTLERVPPPENIENFKFELKHKNPQ